jgi:RHS repeat-associated protein
MLGLASFAMAGPGFYQAPNGGSSNTGGGSGGSGVSGASGAYTHSWSVPLPAGRRGMTPSISFNYSSQGGRSFLGEGWYMPLAHIERAPNGAKLNYCYPVSDKYVFYDGSGGAHDLIPVEYEQDVSILFRTFKESGITYIRFNIPEDTWTVLPGDGSVLEFGSAVADGNATVKVDFLCPDCPCDPQTEHSFAWYLRKHKDSIGNYIQYDYLDQGSQKVPEKIGYAKWQTVSEAPVEVVFEWHDYLYEKIQSCRTGVCVFEDDLRLDKIYVNVWDEVFGVGDAYETRGEYTFHYDELNDSHRMLTKISQISYQKLAMFLLPDYLPDVEFEYKTRPTPGMDFVYQEGQGLPACEVEAIETEDIFGSQPINRVTTSQIDMNGDGILDQVLAGDSNLDVYYGHVDYYDGSIYYSAGPTSITLPTYGDNAIRKSYQDEWESNKDPWGQSDNVNEEVVQDLIDMNGDGLPDWVTSDGCVYLGEVDLGYYGINSECKNWGWNFGISKTNTISSVSTGYYLKEETTIEGLVDVNGDGLVDYVNGNYAYINNGREFGDQIDLGYNILPSSVHKNGASPDVYMEHTICHSTLADMNGDGLVDHVSCGLEVRLNTGGKFETISTQWVTALPGLVSKLTIYDLYYPDSGDIESETWTEGTLLDYNHDGLADYVWWTGSEWKVKLNTGSGFEGFSTVIPFFQFNDEKAIGYSYTEIGDFPINRQTYIENAVMDADADGVLDYFRGGLVYFWQQTGGSGTSNEPLYVMDKVINNQGAETEISYKRAAQECGYFWALPFPLYMVSEVKTHDHITNTDLYSEYEYSGGLFVGEAYDFDDGGQANWPGNREFRGFAEVIAHQKSCPTCYDGATTTVEYYQDLYKAGLPKSKEISGGDSLRKTYYFFDEHNVPTIDWCNQNPCPSGVYVAPDGAFLAKSRQETHVCENTSNCFNKGVGYITSPVTGRVEKVSNYGRCTMADNSMCTQDGAGTKLTYITSKVALDLAQDLWIVKTQYIQSKVYGGPVNSLTKFYHDYSSVMSFVEEGLLTKIEKVLDAGLMGVSTRQYNDFGLITQATDYNDGDPAKVNFYYDSLNYTYLDEKHTEGLSAALGTYLIEKYSRDRYHGGVTIYADPNGQEVHMHYDGFGRLLYSSVHNGETTITLNTTHYHDFEYADTGSPVYVESTTITDDSDNLFATNRVYADGFGRPLQVTSSHDGQQSAVSYFGYDELGRNNCVSKPQFMAVGGFVYHQTADCEQEIHSDVVFDELGRQVSVQQPCSASPMQVSFDIVDGHFHTTVIDEEGKKAKSIANAFGDVVSVIKDPDGIAMQTNYIYDIRGNIIEVDGPEANDTITYTRNMIGQVKSTQLPQGNTWSFDYDKNGRLNWSLSPEGRRVDYTHDKFGRIVNKTFQINGVPDGAVDYHYDTADHYGLGRLHWAQSEAGIATYDYDKFGRTVDYFYQSSPTGYNYNMQFSYKDSGALEKIIYPDGEDYRYSYNPDGSELTLARYINDSIDEVIGHASYRPTGALDFIQTDGGATFDYDYDVCERLTNIHTKSFDGFTVKTVLNRSLTYLNNSTLNTINTIYGDDPAFSEQFTYDSLMRLKTWQGGTNSETYLFGTGDASNKMSEVTYSSTSKKQFVFGDPDFPWAPTESKNCSKVGRGWFCNPTTHTYDDDGKLVSRTSITETRTFEHNARGLMSKSMTDATHYKTWEYDHNNSLAYSSTKNGFLTTSKDYILQYHEGGFKETSYLFFAGQRLAKFDGAGVLSYLHNDEKGSVRSITNEDGTVELAKRNYKPYGQKIEEVGSSAFGFNGMRDDYGDMSRYPLRMYNYNHYHWSSFDPLAVVAPGMLMHESANYFAFADHDPVNNIDPTGGYSVRMGFGVVGLPKVVKIGRARIPFYGGHGVGIGDANNDGYADYWVVTFDDEDVESFSNGSSESSQDPGPETATGNAVDSEGGGDNSDGFIVGPTSVSGGGAFGVTEGSTPGALDVTGINGLPGLIRANVKSMQGVTPAAGSGNSGAPNVGPVLMVGATSVKPPSGGWPKTISDDILRRLDLTPEQSRELYRYYRKNKDFVNANKVKKYRKGQGLVRSSVKRGSKAKKFLKRGAKVVCKGVGKAVKWFIVPIFLYNWGADGFGPAVGEAANDLVWPVSELWTD